MFRVGDILAGTLPPFRIPLCIHSLQSTIRSVHGCLQGEQMRLLPLDFAQIFKKQFTNKGSEKVENRII